MVIAYGNKRAQAVDVNPMTEKKGGNKFRCVMF